MRHSAAATRVPAAATYHVDTWLRRTVFVLLVLLVLLGAGGAYAMHHLQTQSDRDLVRLQRALDVLADAVQACPQAAPSR